MHLIAITVGIDEQQQQLIALRNSTNSSPQFHLKNVCLSEYRISKNREKRQNN